jgi:hypothetical protein
MLAPAAARTTGMAGAESAAATVSGKAAASTTVRIAATQPGTSQQGRVGEAPRGRWAGTTAPAAMTGAAPTSTSVAARGRQLAADLGAKAQSLAKARSYTAARSTPCVAAASGATVSYAMVPRVAAISSGAVSGADAVATSVAGAGADTPAGAAAPAVCPGGSQATGGAERLYMSQVFLLNCMRLCADAYGCMLIQSMQCSALY